MFALASLSNYSSTTQQRASQIWSNVYAEGTLKSHRVAYSRLLLFYDQRESTCWPFNEDTALEFAAFLSWLPKKTKEARKTLAFSTIAGYLDVVSRQHALQFPLIPNPFSSVPFRLFLVGLKRLNAAVVTKARPVELQDLLNLADWMQAEPTPRRVCVWFCALLAFHGALRIANVVAGSKPVVKELFSADEPLTKRDRPVIRWEHIVEAEQGLIVKVPEAKMDQFAQNPHSMLIGHCDADSRLSLVSAYAKMKALGLFVPGQFVCRFGSKSGEVLTRPLFLRDCTAGFGSRPANPFAKGDVRSTFSLHSFRRGWMLLACMLQIPLHDCMRHGGWRSVETAMRYRDSRVDPSPVAAALSGTGGPERLRWLCAREC